MRGSDEHHELSHMGSLIIEQVGGGGGGKGRGEVVRRGSKISA